ncbi:MAG: Clp1/GlmU family protein [Candidatus Bathyarchaeia archaeon]|jgi:polynucleotide 5'-hydroxyl-kinase GRC3/NOL9
MNRTVKKGTTLLVDGPASVTVTSGKVEAFGSVISGTTKVVIREGKRLPFAVEETAAFEIALGDTASAEEVEGNTVPPSWNQSCEEFLNLQAKPITAVVLGTVDSGKTSFCTYLVNRVLGEKRKVAVLDGDLGQSDIGPPSTVAYAFVTRPITDLFSLRAKNAFFVGETSPSKVTDKVIAAMAFLKKEILGSNAEFVVINTDGWVEGECAVNYKIQLIEELNPDIIFCIQQKDELAPLISGLGKFKKVVAESPSAIRQRDIEKRRSLRELGYIKYLGNAKVQSLSLSWLKFEGNELFDICKTRMNAGQASKIYGLLGMKPLQLSERSDRVCIIIGRRRWINTDNVKKVEEYTKKKVVVARKGEEEGLLAGMYDSKRKFLGVGVLQEIDYLRKSVKVSTPVSRDICVLALGKVKLDKNMKEIPTIEEENQIDFASFKKLF